MKSVCHHRFDVSCHADAKLVANETKDGDLGMRIACAVPPVSQSTASDLRGPSRGATGYLTTGYLTTGYFATSGAAVPAAVAPVEAAPVDAHPPCALARPNVSRKSVWRMRVQSGSV